LQCITGNILGALHGAEVIPQRWLDQVDLADLVDAVAPDLHRFRHDPEALDEMGTYALDRSPGV
jgi:hypothetical protein